MMVGAHREKVGAGGTRGKPRPGTVSRADNFGVMDQQARRQARRKGVIGGAMVLAALGMGLGAVASTVTASSRKPLGPLPSGSMGLVQAADDGGAAAAREWARSAYPFGLRDCPRVTDDYYTTCMAQMQVEAKADAADRAARARWAAAEPVPAYIPETPPEAIEPVAGYREEVAVDPAPNLSMDDPQPQDLDGQVEPMVSSPRAG
jgi:hypothetical protein